MTNIHTINGKIGDAHQIINKLLQPPNNVGMDMETEEMIQDLQLILVDIQKLNTDRMNKIRELVGIIGMVAE